MELWILLLFTSLLSLILLLFTSKLNPSNRPSLPPGPSALAFYAKNILFSKKSLSQLQQILHSLHATYGPIIALRSPTKPLIFIEDRGIAHRALVHNGAAFADRPLVREPMLSLSCDRHDISSSPYGPLWRLLRRNMMAEVLQPSRVKLFAPARKWSLGVLLDRLKTRAENKSREHSGFEVKKDFQFAMFCLLVAMCFGEKLEEEELEEIQSIQYSLILIFQRFNYFRFFPRLMKVIFRRKWREIVGIRERQAEIFVPLIRGRREHKLGMKKGEFVYSYVDSLLDIELPEEGGRKLRDEEIVHLCHEFLSGGTGTTSTSLEWIMAELVTCPKIQRKLLQDIEGVLTSSRDTEIIKEEDLSKMSYLKAVILEGLRRHPPGHFTLPHRVAEDVKLDEYFIPKGSLVLFNIVQLGLDDKVWEEPMEFRPERFVGDDNSAGKTIDITGSREIKMMPFGAGRRMCPGYGLAMLHLEYFVANLVREFEWLGVEGEEVDMSEFLEFTTIMKNPLRVRVIPRK